MRKNLKMLGSATTFLTAVLGVVHFCAATPPASVEFVRNPIVTQWTDGVALSAADVNNDGRMDVLATSDYLGEVVWWENLGAHNFTKHTFGQQQAFDVSAADVDGDGDLDIVAACRSLNGQIVWWENQGAGGFVKHAITAMSSTRSVTAADLNGDGDMDLAAIGEFSNEISWWENDGAENFTQHQIATSFSGGWKIRAADLDHDNDLDLVAVAETAHEAAWWENDGSGAFTKHSIDASCGNPHDVCTADVNGDGHVDVLVANGEIAWYQNNGSGGFTKHSLYLGGAWGVYAGDLDNDGDCDIAGSGSSTATWWENFGITFLERELPDAYGDGRVFIADLDNDNRKEILTTSRAQGRVDSWKSYPPGQPATQWVDHFDNGSAGAQPAGWYDQTDGITPSATIQYVAGGTSAQLTVDNAGGWGKVISGWREIDIADFPTLELVVTQMSPNCTLSVAIMYGYQYTIVDCGRISASGAYNIYMPTYTGQTTGYPSYKIILSVEGEQGKAVTLDSVRICNYVTQPTVTPTPTETPCPGDFWKDHFIGTPGQQAAGWADESDDASFNAEIAYACVNSFAAVTKVAGAAYGKVLSPSQLCDVDQYPMVEVKLGRLSASTAWKLGVQETEGAWRYWDVTGSTTATGTLYFDYAAATGLSGQHLFAVVIWVESGQDPAYLELDSVRITDRSLLPTATATATPSRTATPTVTPTMTVTPTRTPNVNALWIDTMDGPAGQQVVSWEDETQDSSYNAEIAYTDNYPSMARMSRNADGTWGKVISPAVTGDVEEFPVVEIRVQVVLNGAWKIGVQEIGGSWGYYDLCSSQEGSGTYAFNYQTATGWTGTHTFAVVLVLEGSISTAMYVDWVGVGKSGEIYGANVGPFCPPKTRTSTITPTPTPTPVNGSLHGMAASTRTATATASKTATPFVAQNQVLPYPNPARGRVNFAYTVSGEAKVTIDVYQFTGERVAQIVERVNGGAGQTMTTAWNAPAVAPGIYVCRIKITDASGRVLLDQKKRVALIK